VLATGSIERPLVFANNDRPKHHAGRRGARLRQSVCRLPRHEGRHFHHNDSAYATALDLQRAGVQIVAIVDPRSASAGTLPQRALAAGSRAASVMRSAAHGSTQVTGVAIVPIGKFQGRGMVELDCDLLCVSGGWSPTLHLHVQSAAAPSGTRR